MGSHASEPQIPTSPKYNLHQQVPYTSVQFHPNTALLPSFIPAPSANPKQVESPGNLGKKPWGEQGITLCRTSPGMHQGPLCFACSHIKPFPYLLRHRERQSPANLQARCQLPSHWRLAWGWEFSPRGGGKLVTETACHPSWRKYSSLFAPILERWQPVCCKPKIRMREKKLWLVCLPVQVSWS